MFSESQLQSMSSSALGHAYTVVWEDYDGVERENYLSALVSALSSRPRSQRLLTYIELCKRVGVFESFFVGIGDYKTAKIAQEEKSYFHDKILSVE